MSDVKTLTVALGARSYDIVVGGGLLANATHYIAPVLPSKRVVIISDENVSALYAVPLIGVLEKANIRAELITVKAGEGSKSFSTFEWLMESLLALKPDRKTTLIALGGGVVGDLTGFAASVLLRGVPFIQMPTTLLAQVDSSVGGKTAINSTNGKNLVGTFYQPTLVLADLDLLATLPAREMRAGYAEVIKYGLICDAEFYRWCLLHGAEVLKGEVNALQHAVLTSCTHKAAIVKADEREADVRALLNFGHTFGHALEAETGFGDTLLHGEAVAIGMVMACRLSQQLGLIGAELETELAEHFEQLGMMRSPADVDGVRWDIERICSHFAEDKKAEAGQLNFIVLDAVGKAAIAKHVDAGVAGNVVGSFL